MSKDQEAHKNHILKLIDKLKRGQATEAEIREIDYWYDNLGSVAKYADGMPEIEKLRAKDKMFRNIEDQIQRLAPIEEKSSYYPLVRVISIAAALLILTGAGLFYLLPGLKQGAAHTQIAKADVKRKRDRALLTLANGRQIALSGAENGILATQGNTTVNKTTDGELVYHTDKSQNAGSGFNTMTTLRGGEYHLALSDGTNVWLNAASSIKYPTAFSGNKRVVEITGEAYFEVAHNAAMPFMVVSKNQTIEVLGTHFNVNSYDNELSTKTTLLQGAVRISANGKFKLLKPGQQSSIVKDNIELAEVDAQEAVAWKSGFFEFTDADIETIMRQVSRWYDVNVVYEGKIPKETFTGRVSKALNLDQLITMIQSPKIHIKHEKGRVMVKN